MSAWRLLLTRPQEESQALAATLSAAGVFSSSLPLLSIQPLAETPEQRASLLDLQRYAAVIVVSKPAARMGLALLEQRWSPLPRVSWFSVGAATASEGSLRYTIDLPGPGAAAPRR